MGLNVTILQASQMTCQGCVNAASAALRKIPGVEEASVDLASQKVTVKHSADVPREKLAEALTKAGFPTE